MSTQHEQLPGVRAKPEAGSPPQAPTLIEAPPQLERRRYNTPNRLSWAAELPYSSPTDSSPTAEFDPIERSQVRRSSWSRPMVKRALVSDALIAALVAAACTASLARLQSMTGLAALLGATIWVTAILLARGYEAGHMGDGAEEFQAIIRAAAGVILAMGITSFVFQVVVPRREVLLAVPLIAVGSAVSRHAQRRALHERRYAGQALLRTVVVGEPVLVQELANNLGGQAEHGFQVVGACVPIPSSQVTEFLDIATLGSVSEVPQVVVDHEIDSVIVVGSMLSGDALRRLSWALERTGAELLVEPGLVEVTGPNVQVRPAAGLSLLHLEPASSRSGRQLSKALLDRILGTLLLLAALPVILCAAVAVRLTSPGSAFFTQPRMGIDGSVFTMFKIRTMVSDAELRKAELVDQNLGDGLMFKMKQDPRITTVGAILRRFSIDELPQLLNVVRGDMSLVGPRPPLVSEYEQYHDAVYRRLRVRPGLTGLWQVSGRADLTWEESVRLDLRYVDNWSIALDLLILWKTARAVLGRSGAY